MAELKRHVIFVAYYFGTAKEIGGNRSYRFCKYLKRVGYMCDVITATEQKGSAAENVTVLADPSRAIWEGSSPFRRSFRNYVELLVRKIAFPGQLGIAWSFDAAARCRQIIQANPDREFVVICSYPAVGVLFTGLTVSLRERVPWIADFRDPVTSRTRKGAPLHARLCDRMLERFVFATASAVIGNVEAAAAVWRRTYRRARLKVHVIPNGFDEEEAPRASDLPDRRERLLVHAGELYEGRNPNAIVQSLSRLRSAGVGSALLWHIVLIGNIADHAEVDSSVFSQAAREGWLELIGPMPREGALSTLARADGLLLLQPQSETQIPAKLFEYICIGRPILAFLHRLSPVTEILGKSGISSVCIYADDPAEVIDGKLVEFLGLPTAGAPYSEWFRGNFNAAHQTEILSAIIAELPKSRT